MIVQNPFMTVCLHRRSSNGGMRRVRLVRRRMERNLECNEPIVFFFSLPPDPSLVHFRRSISFFLCREWNSFFRKPVSRKGEIAHHLCDRRGNPSVEILLAPIVTENLLLCL
ncbi:hypothetical protein CDAR_613121 [Caerostris darwini]|uniref:Uncharacterized protein n=1 Tax=Caerostris darwini TaxID=1538125 RepID=A0AAV4UL26_9ARAC|nr:hypothetical protein CDAR_613121 [Caerostris darwini]